MSDPAAKYADRVAPEHRHAMGAIAIARTLLHAHRGQFEAVLKAEQDMHNFGGLLDPTLYRDMLQSQSFAQQQLVLIKAAIAFLDQLDQVAAAIEPPRAGASAP